MPELKLRGRGLSGGRRSEGFLLLGRASLLVVKTSSASSSASVLSSPVSSFPVLFLSLTRPFSFLLLLLEGGLIWTALYSADLFGLVLVWILGALGVFLLPGQNHGTVDTFHRDLVDITFLAHDLGEVFAIGGDFGHGDEGFEVFGEFYLCLGEATEMGFDFVESGSWVGIFWYPEFEDLLEFEVNGGDSDFPVVFFEGVPKLRWIHLSSVFVLDIWIKAKSDIPYSFVGGFLPFLAFVFVSFYFREVVGGSPICDRGGRQFVNDFPLSLTEQITRHGGSPLLIVGAGEDRDGGEHGSHLDEIRSANQGVVSVCFATYE